MDNDALRILHTCRQRLRLLGTLRRQSSHLSLQFVELVLRLDQELYKVFVLPTEPFVEYLYLQSL